MGLYIDEPSKRACCRICGKLIVEGKQVQVMGYRFNQSWHLNCMAKELISNGLNDKMFKSLKAEIVTDKL